MKLILFLMIQGRGYRKTRTMLIGSRSIAHLGLVLLPVRNLIRGSLLGIRTKISLISQSNASHIKSKCSKFILSAISWYRSLIVDGLIPVFRARSACVHLSSPSLVDSKILIIIAMLLSLNPNRYYKMMLDNVRK